MVDDFCYFARCEAGFDIPDGDPHGVCKGNSPTSSDHWDGITMVIRDEGSSEVASDLLYRRCAKL